MSTAPKSRPKETKQVERSSFWLFLALVTLAMIAIVWPFYKAVLWATLAAIMFQPLYQSIHNRLPANPSRCAITTLLIITFAVLLPAFFIGGLVVDDAISVVVSFQSGNIDIPGMIDQVRSALPSNIIKMLEDNGWGDMADLQARAQEFAAEIASLVAAQALAVGGGVASFALAFGIGLYVTYFMLRDGQQIGESVIHSLPLEHDIAARLVEKFLSIVRATIKGSGVVGLVQGALGAMTFWIAGVPSALLFGVLMAIFSLLPAVGTGIIWLPVAIWLLATGAIWQGVLVIVSGVAVIGMADNVLRPMLVGRDTGIPDWIILITTLGGLSWMGLSGIVVGPLVAGLFLAGWSMADERRGVNEVSDTAEPDEAAA
ncbi:MAG: AI-2E family transporter [Erythrobacter sp.]